MFCCFFYKNSWHAVRNCYAGCNFYCDYQQELALVSGIQSAPWPLYLPPACSEKTPWVALFEHLKNLSCWVKQQDNLNKNELSMVNRCMARLIFSLLSSSKNNIDLFDDLTECIGQVAVFEGEHYVSSLWWDTKGEKVLPKRLFIDLMDAQPERKQQALDNIVKIIKIRSTGLRFSEKLDENAGLRDAVFVGLLCLCMDCAGIPEGGADNCFGNFNESKVAGIKGLLSIAQGHYIAWKSTLPCVLSNRAERGSSGENSEEKPLLNGFCSSSYDAVQP